MWRRWGYLVYVEEMGLLDPCGRDGGYLVHVKEMGLFSLCGGDGFI